jgi:hypothetical protein
MIASKPLPSATGQAYINPRIDQPAIMAEIEEKVAEPFIGWGRIERRRWAKCKK